MDVLKSRASRGSGVELGCVLAKLARRPFPMTHLVFVRLRPFRLSSSTKMRQP